MHTQFEKNARKIYKAYHNISHDFEPHFHSKAEIIYCFSGFQKIKIGENLYTLEGGEAALIFPGTVHEYISVKDAEGTECIVVVADTDVFSALMPCITSHRPKNPIVKVTSETVKYAFRKITETESETELAGWTYLILSDVIREDNLISVKNSEDFKIAPTLVEYINNNFRKPLTIKFLSKEFGYSESYIAHVFCDRLKIPFRTYLGDVRSKYAANLMKTTGKNLTEIAYECGYENVNTFCRCFKRCYGVTPSAYKKNSEKIDIAF